MRLDTSQQMRTDMRLRMAPRMIQSMEILQLPLDGVAGADRSGTEREPGSGRSAGDLRRRRPEAEEPTPTAEPAPAEFDGDRRRRREFEAVPEDDWAESFGEAHRMSRAALSEEADRKHDAMQNMASRPRSLHDDLSDQLGFLDAEPTVRALAEYIIFNLDDNGYLNHDLTRGRPRLRRRRHDGPGRGGPGAWCRSSTRPASVPATSANACSCSSRPTSPAARSCTS